MADELVFSDKLQNMDKGFGKKKSVESVEVEELPKSTFSGSDYEAHKLRPREEWTHKDVFWYFIEMYWKTYEIEPKVDWVRDRQVCKSFVSRYGVDDSVDIIKYFFEEWNGKFRGEMQSIKILSKGSDWIMQKIYHEMRARAGQARVTVTERLVSSSDFLDSFYSTD